MPDNEPLKDEASSPDAEALDLNEFNRRYRSDFANEDPSRPVFQADELRRVATRRSQRPSNSTPRRAMHRLPDSVPLNVTIGSALLSFVLEAVLYGWEFALGLTLMILAHECGHVVAARHYRRPYHGMLFMPFVGAFVQLSGTSNGRGEDAGIAILGPVFGGAVGAAFLALFIAVRYPVFRSLAEASFGLNALNLIPLWRLDGAKIVPVFGTTRGRTGRLWVASDVDRLRYGLYYAGLIVVLVAGFLYSDTLSYSHR